MKTLKKRKDCVIIHGEVGRDVAGCELARAFEDVVGGASILPVAFSSIVGVIGDLGEHEGDQRDEEGCGSGEKKEVEGVLSSE